MERSKPVENFLDKLAEAGGIDRNDTARCIHCKQPFTHDNIFSADGWAETQISGCCEKCFDEMFGEDE